MASPLLLIARNAFDIPLWIVAFIGAAAYYRQDAAAVELVNARDAKLERLIEEAGIREGDEAALEKLLLDADGKASPKYGRLLAEWYVEKTGRTLETAAR